MHVDEIMTKNVVTIDSEKSVWDACDVYNNHKIGCLIVIKDEYVNGIVTERDIIHRVIINQKDPRNTKISDIMSKDIKSISPSSDVKDAAEKMSLNNIKKLPVIADNGDIVGIITITDIANMLPDLLKYDPDVKDIEFFKNTINKFHKTTISNSKNDLS